MGSIEIHGREEGFMEWPTAAVLMMVVFAVMVIASTYLGSRKG